MSKILIVPDIHGRDFWRVIKKYDLYYIDKIIFLGDYLDPYPQEYPDLNKEELYQKTYKNLIDIISLKKDNINKDDSHDLFVESEDTNDDLKIGICQLGAESSCATITFGFLSSSN